MSISPTVTAALHFRTPRDILEKARRERKRYAIALDDKDQVAIADHLFNLAVTILAVRDWIAKTVPAHEKDAYDFVKREQTIARLVDAANIFKHQALTHPPKSDPEIVTQSVTAIRSDPTGCGTSTVTYKSKAALAGGKRFFHLDDADAAIAAWEKFIAGRGL